MKKLCPVRDYVQRKSMRKDKNKLEEKLEISRKTQECSYIERAFFLVPFGRSTLQTRQLQLHNTRKISFSGRRKEVAEVEIRHV